jgi:hypothetical protein
VREGGVYEAPEPLEKCESSIFEVLEVLVIDEVFGWSWKSAKGKKKRNGLVISVSSNHRAHKLLM